MNPALFISAHPDDETLAMGVAIAEHVAAGQDVHLLWLTRGEGSSVRAKLNATSPTPNAWWGLMHDPAGEGYEPLTVEQFGQARIDEGTRAVTCLTAGLPGTLTIHEARLPNDGTMVAADAQAAILDVCDTISPTAGVRLKTHTWHPQLDAHPDHIAAGAAAKQLAVDDPTRFSDVRYYLLPPYWTDPDLTLVAEVWDLPSDAAISARAINAARAYGAWAPPNRYAIGHHSTYAYFAQVLAGPKCLFHP